MADTLLQENRAQVSDVYHTLCYILGAFDASIMIWDFENRNVLHTLTHHKVRVSGVVHVVLTYRALCSLWDLLVIPST